MKAKLQRPKEEETETTGVEFEAKVVETEAKETTRVGKDTSGAEIEAKVVESEATETKRGGNRYIRGRN